MSSEMDSLMYEAADRVDYDEVAETYSGYDKSEKECPDKHDKDKHDKDKHDKDCRAVGYQDVNVCIPVTIKPFGEAGNATTRCIGKAIVSSECEECPGKTGEVCKFTISQKLRVEVPVVFGARAEIGEASIDCGCAERGSKDAQEE